MSRNETLATPHGDQAQITAPASEPSAKPEEDRTNHAATRKSAESEIRRVGLINLERRARFVRFGFGGA